MEMVALPIPYPSVVATLGFAGTEVEYEIGPSVAGFFFCLFWGVVHCSFYLGRLYERRFAPEIVKKVMPN